MVLERFCKERRVEITIGKLNDVPRGFGAFRSVGGVADRHWVQR